MTVTVNDVKRRSFQAEMADSVGDNACFDIHKNGALQINIESPWAGDSESGFGRSCYIELSPADAVALRDWLIAVLPKEAKP